MNFPFTNLHHLKRIKFRDFSCFFENALILFKKKQPFFHLHSQRSQFNKANLTIFRIFINKQQENDEIHLLT